MKIVVPCPQNHNSEWPGCHSKQQLLFFVAIISNQLGDIDPTHWMTRYRIVLTNSIVSSVIFFFLFCHGCGISFPKSERKSVQLAPRFDPSSEYSCSAIFD